MDFEKQELISCALDGLTLALDSINDIEDVDYEIEIILGQLENSYNELLRFFETKA